MAALLQLTHADRSFGMRGLPDAALPLGSTVDDPFVLSALLPWSFFCTESRHHRVRWSLCAKEICFRNRFLGCG